MSTPSDTPRTDAKAYTCDCPGVQQDAVSANFARDLERELTQLIARVKGLEGDAAMLNWLERHPSAFVRWWEIPVEGESLRDAIRAAMNHKTK